jgi:sarcosine oxidase delta subunit
MEMKCPMCGEMMDVEIKKAGGKMMNKENMSDMKSKSEEPDLMKAMQSKKMKMGKY